MKESAALVIAGIVIVGATFAPAQISSQSWKLKGSSRLDHVHFTVERSKIGSRWSNSREVTLERFHGLSRNAIERGGTVEFEYIHDAGRLLCEGRFLLGHGSGTYTFAPDQKFAAELRRLDYDMPDEEELFSMLMSDVSLEFARGVKDAGLDPTTRQLIDLRNHGVTRAYIQDARAAGYRDFTAKDYIDLRIHGVNGDYLRRLRDAGMRNLSASQIARLKIHGVY